MASKAVERKLCGAIEESPIGIGWVISHFWGYNIIFDNYTLYIYTYSLDPFICLILYELIPVMIG